jgi:predicted HicB family RNase H-like nuclease
LVHNQGMETKKPRGRPPVENGERRWLSLRVSDERLERYTQAAERAGETLSAWVKRILDRAAKR